jgi:hypothetical protein
MKDKVTVEVLKTRYEREYDTDIGPKEILERIRDAAEAEPAMPSDSTRRCWPDRLRPLSG